jgi:putative transposase
MIGPRAKILSATCSRHGSRWFVSLNLRAPDFHSERRHKARPAHDRDGFVGLDRGLTSFVVAATSDGTEVGRWPAPNPVRRGMVGMRRWSRAVSRAQPRSHNRAKAVRRRSRQYARIADVRRAFLHDVSSQLVKTHDRLCLEDLAIANLMTNRHLARAIGDTGWAEFARQLGYKVTWFRSELVICDRWFPSTKTCSRCRQVKARMRLAERVFRCDGCGLALDRDRNAAANLAAWAECDSQAPDRQAGGRGTNAPGGEALAVALATVEPTPAKGEPTLRSPERRTPEEGAVEPFLYRGCSAGFRGGPPGR